jgi:DegV family protein with EDD domain
MAKYVIFTDSACDIKPAMLKEWGVGYENLTFRFDGDDKIYTGDDMDINDFYQKMRDGGVAKTAAANPEAFITAFRKILEEGNDILHLGFSSGLSTTYNAARIASLQMAEEFPDRKIVVVDTLAASAGQGLLVYLAVKKLEEGATLEENAEYIKAMIPKLCHWFTVDDLVYLKRGGRISAISAFAGTMLGIKPVLHVDDEGHLVNVAKVRGRRTAVTALADKYGELADDKENGTVFISHADCMADVKLLESILKERYGASLDVITDVGSVIGAHSGPGTLALFFVGKNK